MARSHVEVEAEANDIDRESVLGKDVLCGQKGNQLPVLDGVLDEMEGPTFSSEADARGAAINTESATSPEMNANAPKLDPFRSASKPVWRPIRRWTAMIPSPNYSARELPRRDLSRSC